MENNLSSRSEVTRLDAASSIAILAREICDDVRVFTFSDELLEVAPRRGFALADAIKAKINPVGTQLGMAVAGVYKHFPECERIIVITDEQSCDVPQDPRGTGYIINVAVSQNGIGHGKWITISGFSESVISYIQAYEAENDN